MGEDPSNVRARSAATSYAMTVTGGALMDVIRDAEVDLAPLLERTVAIIGYGNQGRAQALNLRDSGVRVLIGSIADASAARARDDGFEVLDIAAATARGDAPALLSHT